MFEDPWGPEDPQDPVPEPDEQNRPFPFALVAMMAFFIIASVFSGVAWLTYAGLGAVAICGAAAIYQTLPRRHGR